MQDQILFGQAFQVPPNPVVDGNAAATAAEHQQYLGVLGDMQALSRTFTLVGKQTAANGRAAVFAVGNGVRRFGKGSKNVTAFLRAHAVGEPDGKIALVRKAGDFQFFRRIHDGQSHITAFGKD